MANVIKGQAHYFFTGGGKKERNAFWRIIWILRDVNKSNTLRRMKKPTISTKTENIYSILLSQFFEFTAMKG